MPVVRNGQLVGIVSRENLLHALAREEGRHDIKPREGAVARALTEALGPLKWRFERPHHGTEPHGAPMTRADDSASGAADFRRLVAEFENKEVRRREELRHNSEEQQKPKVEELIGTHVSDGSQRNLVHGARAAAEEGLRELCSCAFQANYAATEVVLLTCPTQSGRRRCVVRPPRFIYGGAMI